MRVIVPAFVSVTLTSPFVLALSVLVTTEPAVMLPLPEVKSIVPPLSVPAGCVMLPVPVAVTVMTLVAVALAPTETLPLSAVDCNVKLFADETTPVVLRLPADDSVREPAVAVSPEELMSVEFDMVPDPMVPETFVLEPELETVAAPVLFNTMKLALVLTLPIAPEPSFKLTVVPCALPAL